MINRRVTGVYSAIAVSLFSCVVSAQEGSMSIQISKIEPVLWSKIAILIFLSLIILAILIVTILIISKSRKARGLVSRKRLSDSKEESEFEVKYHSEIGNESNDDLVVEHEDYDVKNKVKISLEEKEKLDDVDINRFLKSDEKKLLDILTMKGCSCTQGTLTTVSNFSKAKVSGLLKELEERKVIYRKKKGRANIVFIK